MLWTCNWKDPSTPSCNAMNLYDGTLIIITDGNQLLQPSPSIKWPSSEQDHGQVGARFFTAWGS